MTKINTPYGEINTVNYHDFLRTAGYKVVNKRWVLLLDALESWVVVNPALSQFDSKRYKQKLQRLPFRDLNFQYAIAKTKKIITDNGVKKQVNDVDGAIVYARAKLFDHSGKPVYLPGMLASLNCQEAGEYYDPTVRPKLYSMVLAEVVEQSIQEFREIQAGEKQTEDMVTE